MNHLFSHLTWSQYLISLTIALVIYYALIGYQYHRGDIRRVTEKLSHHFATPATGEFPFLQPVTEPMAAIEEPVMAEYEQELPVDSSLVETEAMFAAIRAEALRLADEPSHPVTVAVKMKNLLNEYRSPVLEPHRDTINHSVVAECERCGIALLTEEEVDEWW